MEVGKVVFETNTVRVIAPAQKVRRVIKANETPEFKNHRLLVALVRNFAKEYPAEAVRIVREATGQNIALT